MGLTASDYLHSLQALLPPGPAWPRDDGAALTRLLSALAHELARVDSRAGQILEEVDPRTTAELFADWERVAGLPDACAEAYGGEQSQSQRRAALVGRLVSRGGQSPAYFVALAASLGYAISVTEFRPHCVEDDVDSALLDDAWAHVWQVNAPLVTLHEITVDEDVDQPLASWGNALLECVINRLTPAHTLVLFAYT